MGEEGGGETETAGGGARVEGWGLVDVILIISECWPISEAVSLKKNIRIVQAK